jgi:hypothetical protein
MDFKFLTYLSWREILVVIIVLLVLYVLFAFLRISRLRNETPFAQELSSATSRNAIQSYVAVQEPEMSVEPETSAEPEDAAAQAVPEEVPRPRRPVKKQAFAWNEPPSESPEPRRIKVLEQDLAQLRREIGGLRAEVQALREEQRREISKVQVAQNASPFYSDAMQLATQGREAADISVLCGISRAEAELVVALARNTGQALD